MEIHQSEEEQIEALKKWWDENGRSVLVGVVAALAIVLGWQGWNAYRAEQAETASLQYQQFVAAVDSGADDRAAELGQGLIDQYASTPYGPLAGLFLAKLAVEGGDLDLAEQRLQWVMDNAGVPEVAEVARLRLARVLSAKGEHERALALVTEAPPGFAGPFAEARGDIHRAMGERGKARTAYLEALGSYSGSPQKRSMLQMKLDDLAGAGEQDS